MGGLGIDVGRAYVARHNCRTTQMRELWRPRAWCTTLLDEQREHGSDLYSGGSGDDNANPSLGTAHTTVSTVCLNVLEPSESMCGTSGQANAVKVVESATVPTYFMKLVTFGHSSRCVGGSDRVDAGTVPAVECGHRD